MLQYKPSHFTITCHKCGNKDVKFSLDVDIDIGKQRFIAGADFICLECHFAEGVGESLPIPKPQLKGE